MKVYEMYTKENQKECMQKYFCQKCDLMHCYQIIKWCSVLVNDTVQ